MLGGEDLVQGGAVVLFAGFVFGFVDVVGGLDVIAGFGARARTGCWLRGLVGAADVDGAPVGAGADEGASAVGGGEQSFACEFRDGAARGGTFGLLFEHRTPGQRAVRQDPRLDARL